ncbi:MAG: DNA-3-methyladenine glycosylase I [Chloroflexota bacterium]
MSSFQPIYERAAIRKGGEAELISLLSGKPKSADQLAAIPDDRYLAEMTRRIFSAGFVWQVINDKWANFERAFHQFDININASMPDEVLEGLTSDKSIVRNGQKIFTVRDNAKFIQKIAAEHGSFGRFFADWPVHDQVELLDVLKKGGKRLGGNSAQYFMRFMGKDSFILSKDVIATLVDAGVIDNYKATSKRDLKAIQSAFNAWHEETGHTYTNLSRIAAMSIDSPS